MTTYISSLYNNGKQHLSNSASFAQKACQNKIVSTVIDGLFCYIAPTETAIVQGLGIAKYLGKKTIQAISFASSSTKKFISKHEKTKQLLSVAATTANALLGNPRTAIILPALNQAKKNLCDLLKNMYKKDLKQTSYALLNLVENLIIISADNKSLKMLLCINYITKAISELRTICKTYKQKSITETAFRCIKMIAHGYSAYSEVQEELHYFITRRSIEHDPNKLLHNGTGALKIFMNDSHSYIELMYQNKKNQTIFRDISLFPADMQSLNGLDNLISRLSQLTKNFIEPYYSNIMIRTTTSLLTGYKGIIEQDGEVSKENCQNDCYDLYCPADPHALFGLNQEQVRKSLIHIKTLKLLLQKKIIKYDAIRFNCIDFSQSVYSAAGLSGNFFEQGFNNGKDLSLVDEDGDLSHTVTYASCKFKGLLGLVRDLLTYRKK